MIEEVLLQDNQSAMLIENHGRLSCRKGSKHIHIRYFFITDHIGAKEVRVEYCPTGEMVAGFMSKPIQGSTFVRFQDLILGIKAKDFDKYRNKFDKIIKQYGLEEKYRS